MSDETILSKVKSLLNPDYSLDRFILDAVTNKKLRYHQREKKARRKAEKAAAAAAAQEAKEQEKSEEAHAPEPQPNEQEKPRRPSLLNLAEIQAKFQQGLKDDTGALKIPPLIQSTKKPPVPAADTGLKK